MKKSKQTAEISWLFSPKLVQLKSVVNKIVSEFWEKSGNAIFKTQKPKLRKINFWNFFSKSISPIKIRFFTLINVSVYVTDYDLTINGVFQTQKPKLRKKNLKIFSEKKYFFLNYQNSIFYNNICMSFWFDNKFTNIILPSLVQNFHKFHPKCL